MSKATIIANMQYKRPGQFRQVKGLLKYLQFRDGAVRRETYLREGRYTGDDNKAYPKIDRKWIDHGLGGTHKEISTNLNDRCSQSVLARTWVVMPDPELMQYIPEDRRLEVVQRVAEQTMETWYRDNGWGIPEYSCVLHEKKGIKTGLDMPHAHIITPGTIPVQDDAIMLGRMNHYVKRPHLIDLRRTITRTFELEMEHVLGRERAQEVIQQRNRRLEREAKRKQHPRLNWGKLAQAHDVFMLLKQSSAGKKRNKEQRKRQKERERINYTRIYLRHRYAQQREQQMEERREQWALEAVVRRETQGDLNQAELLQARYDQQQYEQEQVERLRRRRAREAQPPRPMDDELWHLLPSEEKERQSSPHDKEETLSPHKKATIRKEYAALEEEVEREFGELLYDGSEIDFPF